MSRSTSKSAVSREFVGRTREHLQALMSRPLADLRLATLMLDGIELKGRCCVVALGVTTDEIKVSLGLWDGSTENKAVTRTCSPTSSTAASTSSRACSVVLDSSKAFKAAASEVFGPLAVQWGWYGARSRSSTRSGW